MSKFKVKLKIQSFELEVEGTRDDIPLISQNIGNEIAGLLEPATNIVEGKEVNSPRQNSDILAASVRPVRVKRVSANKSNHDLSSEKTIDWVHDPAKWGTPQQSWTAAQKAIWILFVVKQEKGISELSSPVIANTFNKHFKQAKTIHRSNVNRDLGRLKTKTDTPVSEDTTKQPSTWFLTQEGIKFAQKLVEEARGLKASEG